METIDWDSLLQIELSAENSEAVYNSILNDMPLYQFDFSKKIIFHSLPSYIVNQNLCFGQPIKPLNALLESEYAVAYSDFQLSHVGCFKCVNKYSTVEMASDGKYVSENSVCYLPCWIEEQLLFENEPIRPPSTVEEFFTYYVVGNMDEKNKETIAANWNNFHQKNQMIAYYSQLEFEYNMQHMEWLENVSDAKRKRYEKFLLLKNQSIKKVAVKRKLDCAEKISKRTTT
jgi:hypothetical protein